MRVIGIDPGLANTGWGIIDYTNNRYSLIKYGVIETKSDESLGIRLLYLYNRLVAVLGEYKVDGAGIEKLFFARNVTSAMGVAQAQGVAELCFAQYNIPLFEYTPNQIKQAVTGVARADKETVQQCVKLLLKMEVLPKPDHAADALAAAITYCNYSGLYNVATKIM